MESLSWSWKKQISAQSDGHVRIPFSPKKNSTSFQNLHPDKDPIKLLLQYSGQAKAIPVFENFQGRFKGGNDVGRIWKNYHNVNDNFHKHNLVVFLLLRSSMSLNRVWLLRDPGSFVMKNLKFTGDWLY
jgi:hypothetical protein